MAKKKAKKDSVGRTSQPPKPAVAPPDDTNQPPKGAGYLTVVMKAVVLLLLTYGIAVYEVSPSTGRNLEATAESSEKETLASAPPTVTPQSESCDDRFRSLLPMAADAKARSLPLMLHRNGEPEACGESTVGEFLEELLKNFRAYGCKPQLDKYRFEAMLTATLHRIMAKNNACHSMETYGDQTKGLLGYCDSGEDHTPILLDHDKLVPLGSKDGSTSLPCHFHTREGLRLTQAKWFSDLVRAASSGENKCEGDNATQTCTATPREAHLYAVPAGRVFMFAPSHVGEIFHLPHVTGASSKAIYLEVLSLKPRVFDVFNFFSRAESKELVDRAIAETSASHRIKRSTTGAGTKSLNSRRTSESGFDTHGKTALTIKRRCFSALGFDEYEDGFSDGLQILRYNVSKAYNSHLDYIEDRTGELKHDYDSAGTGGNRFATILLYMSDLGENDGGETVFPHGIRSHIPEEERITKEEALEQLRASDQGSVLEPGSWEESLVAVCRSKLSVRPHSSRAVLFYSQHPNGSVDKNSLHGACPVLNDQKYAANLWVWNTPRDGFAGSPIKKKFRNNGASVAAKNLKITGVFSNSGTDPRMDRAELFYRDQFWGKLGKGDPVLTVNTYQGHVWNVKVDGNIVKTWEISEENGEKQEMTV